MKTISTIAFSVLITCTVLAQQKPAADGWVRIFDGKSLTGWKAAENPATFSVEDSTLVVFGPRAHLFYDGPVGNHSFRNFEWKVRVKTMPKANSGMFIHTTYQENGWPAQGYEIQVNQTHPDWRKTGSVYGKQDVKETVVKDGDWYTQHVIVTGKQVVIKVNDEVINSYTEPDSVGQGTQKQKLGTGTIAIQGHDPESKIYYKDIMVRVLPD